MDLLGNFVNALRERRVAARFSQEVRTSENHFSSLSNPELVRCARAIAKNPNTLSNYRVSRVAENLCSLITELNRRGLLSASVDIISSQIKSPNTVLRCIDPTIQLGEQLVAQCVAAVMMNFYSQGKNSERNLIRTIKTSKAETQHILDKLHFLIKHASTTEKPCAIVEGVDDLRTNFRIHCAIEYNIMTGASIDSKSPILAALEDIYACNPTRAEAMPFYLKQDIDYRDFGKKHLNAERVAEMRFTLQDLFDKEVRVLPLIEVFSEWAIGSTEAEKAAVINGMTLPKKPSCLRYLGVNHDLASSEECEARACHERFLKDFLFMHVAARCGDPEAVLSYAFNAITCADKVKNLGQIRPGYTYKNFRYRFLNHPEYKRMLYYWSPTCALKLIDDFVRRSECFNERTDLQQLRVEFGFRVVKYNQERGISVTGQARDSAVATRDQEEG